MNREEIEARQATGGARKAETAPADAELLELLQRMREAAGKDPARRRDVTIGEFLVDGSRVPLQLAGELQQLTRTEAAALRFAGWGRSNADIATLLAISEGTARTHLNSAVRKLDCDGMRELIALGGLLFHPLD